MKDEQRLIEEYWVEFEEDNSAGRFTKSLFEMCDVIKYTIILVFVLFSVVFRTAVVDGDSMLPGLNNRDWLLISSYSSSYKRGDIVVISQPWENDILIIKRVIGVGGDTIDIDFTNGDVYINGILQNETYVNSKTNLQYDVKFPLTVEEGKVFVLGDNRNNSLDSRSSQVGTIDENYIMGKVQQRIFKGE